MEVASLKRNLSVANGIMGGIYALDNGQRILAYGALLWICKIKARKGGEKLPLALFLKDFYVKMSDARFLNRFFCLPSIIEELLGYYGSGKKLPEDTESVAGRVMALSMLPYYPLDHLYYLATLSPNILGLNADRMSRWSCIAWTVYVVADLVAAWARISNLLEEAKRSGADTGEKSSKVAKLQRQQKITNLLLRMACALCDLPMAMHWSVSNGPLNDKQIGWLGVGGGIFGLWLKWRRATISTQG